MANFAAEAFIEVPDDRMYRYRYALGAAVQFATLVAVVLFIARPGPLADVLALRRPSSWRRAAGIGAGVTVAGVAVLVVLDPILRVGEAQGYGVGWDAARAPAFVANAVAIVLVGPLVEEVTFRGLGFRLLERFGQRWAIVLSGVAFALSHGLFRFLPATVVFGLGLGYLRSRTRSLYPGIVVHVVFNALGVLGSVAG